MVEFDTFSVVLLMTPREPPQLDETSADAIQDAHLHHLATLHEAGDLLAAGPLQDPERKLRGISIFKVGAEKAQALCDEDPAVQAGVFDVGVFPWLVPAGALHHAPTRFPHSGAEAES